MFQIGKFRNVDRRAFTNRVLDHFVALIQLSYYIISDVGFENEHIALKDEE